MMRLSLLPVLILESLSIVCAFQVYRQISYSKHESHESLSRIHCRRSFYAAVHSVHGDSDSLEEDQQRIESTSRFRRFFKLEEGEDQRTAKDGKIWQRWSRGTSRVIHREAEELGGMPRSDRYSSNDWLHITLSLPRSTILRQIRYPVFSVTIWGTILSLVNRWVTKRWGAKAAEVMCIPSGPHSLMMSSLGLLLVFRTNSAYQRFAEGRKIWETIVNVSRDFYRMIVLYENEIGPDKRRRLQRLLAAFPYLLRHRIRPNLVMRRLDDEEHERDPDNSILLYQDSSTYDMDEEAGKVAQSEEETGTSRRKTRQLYWVDKRTLPWRLLPADALEQCAGAQNRPLWVSF